MDFKEYPSYKDSGVECLGEVPEHWKILQTRHLFSFGKGLTITKENLSDEGIPCINYGEIHSKYGFEFNPSDNPLKCVSHDFIESNKNCLLNEGDFIFADTSEDLDGSGNFSYLNQESIVFAGYHSIIARLKNQKNNARFFAYLFDSQAYRNQVRTEMKGVKVFSVSQGVLKSRFAWLPPNEEQVKIISFLDSETSRIDNLIAKQEKLIEKLEEHRKSVISHAVTKGLDPNAKMKDSGVEWLGEVPRHWKLLQTRHIFNFGKGLTITKENLSDEGIPCINYGEVHSKYGFEFNPSDNPLKCVSYDFIESNKNCLLNKGDFIFADTSEDLEGSGNFSHLNQEAVVFAGYHTIIAKPKNGLNHRYLAYMIDSQAYRGQIRAEMKGVKVYSVSQGVLKSRLAWLPPIEEQDEIVKLLDEKSSKIDKLIAKQKLLIEKLKNHRTSIISHAVTGKIDVRDLVA